MTGQGKRNNLEPQITVPVLDYVCPFGCVEEDRTVIKIDSGSEFKF